MPSNVNVTVKQLNAYVKSLLEGDATLASITLIGEISNFKNHYASGHCYFVLKDQDAAIRAVMFRGNAAHLNFVPQDGLQVACRGYVSIYERDGSYQFYAESMQPLKQGDLAAEFERVKNLLEKEGLFSAEFKKPIPEFPKKMGVITSDTGAALQDILNVSLRRYPLCDVVVFPALVQGSSAPASLIAALDRADSYKDLDVIIIGRGGGSAEDLSCFNDEALARKIFATSVPIISAVGHETDFTIADFVADLRAPTPSAAAEIAVPNLLDIKERFTAYFDNLAAAYMIKINNFERRLLLSAKSRVYLNPALLYNPFEQRLVTTYDQLKNRYQLLLSKTENRLLSVCTSFEQLSPLKTLDRGFAAVFKDQKAVRSAKTLKRGDRLVVRFKSSSAVCAVEETTEEKDANN